MHRVFNRGYQTGFWESWIQYLVLGEILLNWGKYMFYGVLIM